LPAIKLLWPQFADQANKEGWPAARFLTAIAEHQLAERDRRRIERHLAETRFFPERPSDTFAFEAVPMISKAKSQPSLPLAGERRKPVCYSDRPVAARAIWLQLSAWP
jgi:DNA replication protein DnaC